MLVDCGLLSVTDLYNYMWILPPKLPSRDQPPVAEQPPPAAKPIFNDDIIHIFMGVDSGVLWVADFDNGLRFYVRRPTRRLRVTAARRHTLILRK